MVGLSKAVTFTARTLLACSSNIGSPTLFVILDERQIPMSELVSLRIEYSSQAASREVTGNDDL